LHADLTLVLTAAACVAKSRQPMLAVMPMKERMFIILSVGRISFSASGTCPG
jgi:hypothetical protein